jgi:hypothetical protein
MKVRRIMGVRPVASSFSWPLRIGPGSEKRTRFCVLALGVLVDVLEEETDVESGVFVFLILGELKLT